MKTFNIKTIIFDIDGTLMDTYTPSVEALRKALLSVVGIDYKEDDLAFHFGIPLDDSLARLNIDNNFYPAIQSKIDEYYYRDERSKKVFPGIEKVLKVISENDIVLGIVTSRDKREVEMDFNKLSISKHFDVIITADDAKRHKPHPDPIDKFIKVTNSSKSETIYIGDTKYDCEAAHAAGIRFALAGWGALNKEKIKADYFLSKPEDILKLI
ncbi:MAG: HAD family hydrolase [Bacilli bacterium]|nr:HAD family hydrolase [Bacilli bacterium]MDD4643974.1 HAD family hydrolase [Bacilli bacterium]